MAFELPTLDDRTFQDIVDEAKSRISYYCEEWTDHNVSDPGITLIELFAWMMEMILYRMNQVPRHHYVQFMKMLGIRLEDPVPAKAMLTFWLSKPQPSVRLSGQPVEPMKIGEGTTTATTQTETEPSIAFTTDQAAKVQAPELTRIVRRITRSNGQDLGYSEIELLTLESGRHRHYVFARNKDVTPLPGSALYFGFETDLSQHILQLTLKLVEAGGEGVIPDLPPPYTWEASTGEEGANRRWAKCIVDQDSTHALNAEHGSICLLLPDMGKRAVHGHNLFWVRVRLHELSDAEKELGIKPYSVSPQLQSVVNEQCLGISVPSTQARLIRNEYVGRSNGSPGQRFQLRARPVLERDSHERLLVQEEGKEPERWTEVNGFAESGLDDMHYTVDSDTGGIRLGPAVRQRDGAMRLYGRIPERGALLTFERYRSGGGHRGNVRAGAVNTLKTSIPYVARIENRQPARGGLDAESIDEAMMKASAMIRARERAVTEEDFEFIAQSVLNKRISRVKCIQPRPESARNIADNLVYVLVMARVDFPEGPLTRKQLTLNEADRQELSRRLEERRLLTMQISIQHPAFYWAAVRVHVGAAIDADRTAIEREILRRLYRLINPIVGGQDGKGWEFGRNLYRSDIYPQMQGVPGVRFIRRIELFETDEDGVVNKDEPQNVVEVAVRHGVIISGRHQVEFVQDEG